MANDFYIIHGYITRKASSKILRPITLKKVSATIEMLSNIFKVFILMYPDDHELTLKLSRMNSQHRYRKKGALNNPLVTTTTNLYKIGHSGNHSLWSATFGQISLVKKMYSVQGELDAMNKKQLLKEIKVYDKHLFRRFHKKERIKKKLMYYKIRSQRHKFLASI